MGNKRGKEKRIDDTAEDQNGQHEADSNPTNNPNDSSNSDRQDLLQPVRVGGGQKFIELLMKDPNFVTDENIETIFENLLERDYDAIEEVGNDESLSYDERSLSEEEKMEKPNEFSKFYKVVTIAGNGTTRTTDDYGTSAGIYWPYEIKFDHNGDGYFTAYGSSSIRKFSPNGHVTTFLSRPSPTTSFSCPRGLALDKYGNIFVADMGNNDIKKITPLGICSVISPDPALSAPYSVAIDKDNNIIVSDTNRNTIRKIFSDGRSITIAGRTKGYQDGKAEVALFDNPQGLVLDKHGNIIVADSGNNKIRKITPEGVVTTIPENCDESEFSNPYGVALDESENIYVADYGRDRIRKINQKTGKIMTIAGFGLSDFKDQPDRLSMPTGLTVHKDGSIIVCDCYNHIIRKIQFRLDQIAYNWPQNHLELPLQCKVTIEELLCILMFQGPVDYLPKEILVLLSRTLVVYWPCG